MTLFSEERSIRLFPVCFIFGRFLFYRPLHVLFVCECVYVYIFCLCAFMSVCVCVGMYVSV